MTDDSALIAALRHQEEVLQFDVFDEATAYALGNAVRERGIRDSLPIVCAIATWNRPLFYMALPGTNGDNQHWVRRKTYIVQRFGKSSFRGLIENRRERVYALNQGADPTEYALHGGAFPIRVRRVGDIGAICVSGLPESEDHRVVVETLADFLGVDRGEIALPQ